MLKFPTVIRAGHYNSRKRQADGLHTEPRTPGNYELDMFSEDGGIAYYNGESKQIRKGDILLARPGDVRHSILPVRCYYVHFTATDPSLIALLDSMSGFAHTDRYSAMEQLFQSLRAAYVSADDLAPAISSARAVEILWQIRLGYMPAGQVASRDPIKQAVRIIQRDYRKDLTVETLAEKCNLSVSYFHKLFLQSTGTTPNRFLMQTRLTAAKAMLLAGNQSVGEVAERCGFSSQGYFCDCMKKYTGMSPRQFRAQANYPEQV